MVDEMIKDSPVQSPITTVPSSPLEFDGNNNVISNDVWENDGRHHTLTSYHHPLGAQLAQSKCY